MKIIAHRGASREYPENTLDAFRRAVEIGVDEIETDLVETREGIIVLHHDETLHLGAENRPIRQLTFAEVKQINPAVPELHQVLAELGKRVPFCLEIKTTGLAARVADALRKYDLEDKTHLTSFQTTEVLELKRLCPAAAFSWTFTALPEGVEAQLREAGINAVSLSSRHMDRETVKRLTRAGIKTRVYTVNDPSAAEQYASWGVDAIFTDDPAAMKRFR